jgi:hypothetical protein
MRVLLRREARVLLSRATCCGAGAACKMRG